MVVLYIKNTIQKLLPPSQIWLWSQTLCHMNLLYTYQY